MGSQNGDIMTMKTGVFDRTEALGRLVSPAVYNLILGLVLCWGFFVNWLMVVKINPQSIASIDFRLFLIGYFASCFLGVYLFNRSTNPLISFLGYNLDIINLFLRILRTLGRRR